VVFGPSTGGSLVLDASAGTGTTLLGGTAASTISGGTNGVYFLNGPTDFIGKAGSSNLIAQFPGSGPATISAAATTSDTIFGSNGGFQYLGGSGGATVVAGDGSSNTASATTGGLVYFGNSGSATVTAGAGGATILGGTGASPTATSSITFSNTGGSLQYSAGIGSEAINASTSSTNNLFFSTPDFTTGAATIVAGSGNDTLIGSSGNATMTGGTGNDQFEFNTTNFGGHDLITDFSASTVAGANDQLVLFGYNAEYNGSITASAAVVRDYVPDGSGNGSVTLPDGTKISFTGISSGSQLTGHVVST
jgi:Ca2+-binding RTX toxin-like protein